VEDEVKGIKVNAKEKKNMVEEVKENHKEREGVSHSIVEEKTSVNIEEEQSIIEEEEEDEKEITDIFEDISDQPP